MTVVFLFLSIPVPATTEYTLFACFFYVILLFDIHALLHSYAHYLALHQLSMSMETLWVGKINLFPKEELPVSVLSRVSITMTLLKPLRVLVYGPHIYIYSRYVLS
jgi:hypothetical protein